MLDTLHLYRKLSADLSPQAAETLAESLGAMYTELKETVTKADFSELKAVVAELAEAQNRTEKKVEELAEAQNKTELRLDSLTVKVEELAEAQKRTEQRLDSLTIKVEELAEAQKRTEQRLDSLTIKVAELAEAQKKTEETVRGLVSGQDQIRRDLGSLQRTFSYAFENEAYRMLPGYLEKRFGFTTHDRLLREYIDDVEINFIAFGERNGERTLLVGESKLRIRPSDVPEIRAQMENHVEIVRATHGDLPVLIIAVTHSAHPRAIEALAKHDIHVIQSFDW